MRVLKVRVRILGRRPCLAAFAALFMGGLGSVVGPMQARSHTFWTLSNVGPVLPGPTRSWLAVRRHPSVLDGVARILARSWSPVRLGAWSFCWPFARQSQSGEFEPLPVFTQIESVSQEGGACAGLLGAQSGCCGPVAGRGPSLPDGGGRGRLAG